MTPDDLREFCLALPQATETYPFGEEISVFKTSGNGKIFALASLDVLPLSVSLKCDPEESLALREAYPEITPGYHLNKKHWITVVLGDAARGDGGPGGSASGGGVPDELVQQLLHDSHALVRPKIPRARG